MATAITIQTSRSTDHKSITITSASYLDLITSIDLNFYTTTLLTPVKTYIFTEQNISDFVANGTITLTFLSIFDSEFIQDNWYVTQIVGNIDEYVSNYDGFGIYTYVKTKVFEQINSLHTPETSVSNIETLFMKKVFLEGLQELDNSTVISRDVKFKKRLLALTKLLT